MFYGLKNVSRTPGRTSPVKIPASWKKIKLCRRAYFCAVVLFIELQFNEFKSFSMNSGGSASVSFEVNFTRISWTSILTLQLALEQRTFLGSRGMFDEAGCSNVDDDHCKLE